MTDSTTIAITLRAIRARLDHTLVSDGMAQRRLQTDDGRDPRRRSESMIEPVGL